MLARTADLSQLLAAARAGCRESLGRVFQDCKPYVLDIARREVPPNLQVKGSASDLVQETFLEAVHRFDHFSGDSEAQLKGWLRQLLRRRIFKLFRRYQRTQKRCIGLERPCGPAGEDGLPCGEVPADVPTPSVQVIVAEQTQALLRAVEHLPEDYRRVIRLRYEEERSFEEIGVLMHRSGNAARLLWLRAVDALKVQLRMSDAR